MTNPLFSSIPPIPEHFFAADHLSAECENLITNQINGQVKGENNLTEKIQLLSFENLIKLHEVSTSRGQERIASLHQEADRKCRSLNVKKTYLGLCGLHIAVIGGVIKMSLSFTKRFGLPSLALACGSIGLVALYINGFCLSYFFAAAKMTRLILRFEEAKLVNKTQNTMFQISDQLARSLIISSNVAKDRLQQELDHLTKISDSQTQKIADQSELIAKHGSMIKALRSTIGIGSDLTPTALESEERQFQPSQYSPTTAKVKNAFDIDQVRALSMAKDLGILPSQSTPLPLLNDQSKQSKPSLLNCPKELMATATDLSKKSTVNLAKSKDLLDSATSLVNDHTLLEKAIDTKSQLKGPKDQISHMLGNLNSCRKTG